MRGIYDALVVRKIFGKKTIVDYKSVCAGHKTSKKSKFAAEFKGRRQFPE